MRNFKLYSVFALLLVLATSISVTAATNIYGLSGGLELSTDTVLSPGQFSIGYTRGFEIFGNDDANFFSGAIGIAPGFEIGIGFVDPEDIDSATLLNAKYRFLAETATRPAITVGVVDLASDLEIQGDDDPSFFLLVSKTLTRWVEDVTDEESKPIRGHIGFGSGLYDGLLLGLDWVLSPEFQATLEYVGEGVNDGDFNALLRYALTNNIRLDAGAVDFDSWTIGINFTSSRF